MPMRNSLTSSWHLEFHEVFRNQDLSRKALLHQFNIAPIVVIRTGLKVRQDNGFDAGFRCHLPEVLRQQMLLDVMPN